MDEFSAFAGFMWNDWRLESVLAEALLAFIHAPKPADPSQSAEVNGDDGYQWKQLFLPEGTRLRASFKRQTDYAVVSGTQIRCGEHTVSPSGFANLRGSGNRNAWKAVWLRFPGTDQWLLADVCRRQQKSATARLFGCAELGPAPAPQTRQPRAKPAAPQRKSKSKHRKHKQGKRHRHEMTARLPVT
jgi:hypothetical protein